MKEVKSHLMSTWKWILLTTGVMIYSITPWKKESTLRDSLRARNHITALLREKMEDIP